MAPAPSLLGVCDDGSIVGSLLIFLMSDRYLTDLSSYLITELSQYIFLLTV